MISLSKPLVSHADLLAPVMKADDARLVHRSAPWAAKAAKAFFRRALPPRGCCVGGTRARAGAQKWAAHAAGALCRMHARLGWWCTCRACCDYPLTNARPCPSHHLSSLSRGVPSCGEMPFPPGCARSWVARLAQDHPDLLDAGLVEPYGTPEQARAWRPSGNVVGGAALCACVSARLSGACCSRRPAVRCAPLLGQVRGDPVLRDGRGPLPVLPCAPMSRLPYYK